MRRPEIRRRAFLSRMGHLAAAGAVAGPWRPTAAAARQVPPTDGRLTSERARVPSPGGPGEIAGYFVRPRPRAGAVGPETLPAILLLPEDRLTPQAEDVARRVALESFMVFAPDLMYRGDPDRVAADIQAAALWVKNHTDSTGRLGVIGFGAGGAAARALAVRMGPALHAAVSFDGAAPAPTDEAWERAMLSLIRALT
jgi:carboxymethylenebutenolidase